MEIITKIVNNERKSLIIGSSIIAFVLLFPIIILCLNFFTISDSNFNYLWKNLLFEYFINSIYLIFIAVLISLVFGVIPAWFISFYDFKYKSFFDMALYLPLAIPTYIMAFTYSDLLSYTGLFQVFIRDNLPFLSKIVNQDYLKIELLGCILGFALYPYVYTSSRISFSYIGSSYIQMSKNLGLSNNQIFFKVFLPLSRPAIFSGIFLITMEVLNEYGAVKYFGVNTFTTGIFRSWFSMGNEQTAIQLSFLLFLFVFFILILEKRSQKMAKFTYKTNTNIVCLNSTNQSNILIYFICGIPFLFGFVIPFLHILSNCIKEFNYLDFSNLLLLTFNSIKISSITSILVVILALLLLYVERISNKRITTIINQLTSIGYVIPGAVIGLSIIIMFTQTPILNNYSFLGSFIVLIYAYIFRFLVVGKTPIKSSLEKQPISYDDTAKNLGLSYFKILKKIHFPLNKMPLIIAFIVTFLDLIKELPLTLILRPFNFDTLATQTYEFAIEEMLQKSSVYSIVIILIGSILLIFLRLIINKDNYVS